MSPEFFEYYTVDDGYVEPYYRISRMYNQYASQAFAMAWSEIVPILGSEIGNAYNAIAASYNIDKAISDQLDVIGRVIGVDRSIVGSVEFTVFECGDDSVECGNDSAQCSVRYLSDSSDLEDEYFRPLLKAKVAKNTSYATIDSIILATKIIAGAGREVRLRDSEDMTFTIELYGGISAIERDLIGKGVIPTPQGVRLRGVLDGFGIVECDDDLLQCGDESTECIGLIEVI